MNYYELEHKYNHFQKEYENYMSESFTLIIVLALYYLCSLITFFDNKTAYALLLYFGVIIIIFRMISNIIKLLKIEKQLKYYDHEIFKIFIQEDTTNK